ncbi:hypothetical protein E2C01_020796 [Portunus trituberculatus]|uniref:Uncharacterized protein n=1 Tax=Portunus trituberculatus TaxID=210409 RepID=A0A5B7E157_PORTR|nr:hypothetical protein [Portunus trituberculatus]
MYKIVNDIEKIEKEDLVLLTCSGSGHGSDSYPVTHSLNLFFGLPIGCQPPTLTSSTSLNTPPSALLTRPTYLNLLFLSSKEMSLTPHISVTSLLDLPSCHLTPAMYLGILWSQLHRIFVRLFVNAHVSLLCTEEQI